jgi:hypothetical protein
MPNSFNFAERFTPFSNLQATVVEFDDGKFIIAPEGMISCNLQEDHAVVWYHVPGEDLPRFAQMSEFVNYRQVMTALLPVDLPWGTAVPQDLLAVLESAPEEVLVAYATWADDFDTDRYPSVRETWEWLNATFGASFAAYMT